MKIIYTNKNEQILVDEDDYSLLSRHTWDITNFGYARTTINKKQILMHKLILPTGSSRLVTDHINRNKLDNRKENLRIISRTENNYNHSHKVGVTGFMGVYGHSDGRDYYASFSYNNKTVYLGRGETLEETAKLRDYAVWLVRGEIGVYNFPNEDYSKFEHPKKQNMYDKVMKVLKGD